MFRHACRLAGVAAGEAAFRDKEDLFHRVIPASGVLKIPEG